MTRPDKRASYVVILRHSEFNTEVIGPYRTFKRADADARAMGGVCVALSRILSTGEIIREFQDGVGVPGG